MKKRLPSAIGSSILEHVSLNDQMHVMDLLINSKGICPTVEYMHEKKIITHELMKPSMTKEDLDDVIEAFMKVSLHLSEINV